MAIGHLSIRAHSRSKGHTVAAALAYRMGLDLVDPRTGVLHAFARRSKRGDIVDCGMVGTGSFTDVAALATAMEKAERRKNSTILRDVQTAVPCELDNAQGVALLREFAERLAERYGTHCGWSMHRPDRRGDARNKHGHIVLPTRQLGGNGFEFGRKLRILDDRETGPEEVKAVRKLWETMANGALERAGQVARVDVGRRSDGDPAPTLGAECTALERETAEERGEQLKNRGVAQVVANGAPVTWRGRQLREHRQRQQAEGRRRVRLVHLKPPAAPARMEVAGAARRERPHVRETHAHVAATPTRVETNAPVRAVRAVHADAASKPARIERRMGTERGDDRPLTAVRAARTAAVSEPVRIETRARAVGGGGRLPGEEREAGGRGVREVQPQPVASPARGESFSDLTAALERVKEARRRHQAKVEAARKQEARRRRELAGRTAAVRATSTGGQRLDEARRARSEAASRALTLDEEWSVLEPVERQLDEDLDRRAASIAAVPGGEALRRVVERRRGGPPGSLAEREETLGGVEQRLLAADEAEALLPATAPDPARPGYRVPAVPDAVLDSVATEEDGPFVEDTVFLLRARYAQRAQQGAVAGGYDAAAREESARRHFGSALGSAVQWCVRKIRELVLTACHKVLGGRGDSGKRVQASLEVVGEARRTHQHSVESAAQRVAIDVEAFTEEARSSGRDAAAALEKETARRGQVLTAAGNFGVDVGAVLDAAEAQAAGSGFPAIKAELARWDEVVCCAEDLGIPRRRVDTVRAAADARRPGSGYDAVVRACVGAKAREEVRKVLPVRKVFPGGADVLAVSTAMSKDLLDALADDKLAHTILRAVVATPAAGGEEEEREEAETVYHRPATARALKQLQQERRWFSSQPTAADARQAVLARFVPELAERVRTACDQVRDLDRLRARTVDEDRVRRVVDDLQKRALPLVASDGGGERHLAVSDKRLERIAARAGDQIVAGISDAFRERHSYTAALRAKAEETYLKQSGTSIEEYEAKLLRIIKAVCRSVPPRAAADLWRDRAQARSAVREPHERPARRTGPVPSHPDRGRTR